MATKSEFGGVLIYGASYDLSGNTSLSMTITRPDATVLTVTPTIVNAPITVAGVTYAANQYFKYVWVAGDLSLAGVYSIRPIYTDASKKLIGPVATLTVLP